MSGHACGNSSSPKECFSDTVTLLETLILAVIQGVTEWLPISSSGHLVVAQEYLGLRLPVFFDVILHVGSLLVVLIVFWSDVVRVMKALIRLDFRSEEGRLGLYIFLGTVATIAIGFAFRGWFESFFQNLLAVGVAFVLTGSYYSLLYVFRRGEQRSIRLSSSSAILIGVAQGVSLIPGVSRSGSTIATGLLLRVDRKEAFRFSFLLFIPAVVGAALVTSWDARSMLLTDVDPVNVFLGLAATMVVGYLSLKLLLRILLRGRLPLFAFYCWALGFILVLTQTVHF